MKKVLGACLALGAFSAVQAQLYVYDDFSASDSGMGFSESSWSSPITYSVAIELAPGLGQYVENSNFGESFRRISATAKAAIDARTAGGQTFWVGFLTRWHGAAGPNQQNYGGVQLRQGASGTGSKRFFLGAPWEAANWGAGTEGDTNSAESGIALSETVRLITCELNLTTGLADMYVDNSLVLTGLAINSGSVTMTTLDVLKIEAGSGDGQKIAVDELRIGATSADVQPVPEPATMAVLGLGALALIRRRK
ncbi:MAG TPA: PEP-CTERM sorting domain-containing protein [Fimbriimonadaceae bacterium]|nr:PEP-CTERM sorting domain-containing protein [Fimbriimonadaceae bacterium]